MSVPGKGPTAKKPIIVLGKETPKIAEMPKPRIVSASESSRRIERPKTEPTEAARNEAMFKQGMTAFRDHRIKEAKLLFKQVLLRDPRNVDAYFNLGSIAEAERDYLEALTYYRAALATNPADKDLKVAVHSMEEVLRKQKTKDIATTPRQQANLGGGTKTDLSDDRSTPVVTTTSDKTVPVGMNQQGTPITDVATVDAPTVPAQQIDPKTFSLQTAQNGLTVPYVPMNAMNAPYQYVPTYGVPPTLSGNVPANNYPIRNISPTPGNHGTVNTLMNVGVGFALRGSGLHCPICRIMGGLH